MRGLLIAAQLLTLVALGACLLFVADTTGGTLFLFSTLDPLLVAISSVAILGSAISVYRRRHSLFSSISLKAGQIVFRQGEPGDCAYFIRSGSVRVVRGEGEGQIVLARLGPGQYFGEMALVSNEPRNATIQAAEATALSILGKHNFLSLLEMLPAAREHVLTTVRARSEKTRD